VFLRQAKGKFLSPVAMSAIFQGGCDDIETFAEYQLSNHKDRNYISIFQYIFIHNDTKR